MHHRRKGGGCKSHGTKLRNTAAPRVKYNNDSKENWSG
jgi:hypothetical protein